MAAEPPWERQGRIDLPPGRASGSTGGGGDRWRGQHPQESRARAPRRPGLAEGARSPPWGAPSSRLPPCCPTRRCEETDPLGRGSPPGHSEHSPTQSVASALRFSLFQELSCLGFHLLLEEGGLSCGLSPRGPAWTGDRPWCRPKTLKIADERGSGTQLPGHEAVPQLRTRASANAMPP